ncbi:FHA domain-containing protein [Picosynechococcus sp. NKBG15041c]|uniref:FHA domain-containing protein n=1 Tax=Picosynechococcus sp. NKBG15041c TaxID=1407650 RepID=UPI0004162B35|nr:FHA domain-containing protein [Picosynechococcus sp. NKBG15041c]
MTTLQQVWLSWQDPTTNDVGTLALRVPIALGRDPNSMPAALANHPSVAKVTLNSSQVSRYHALIFSQGDQLWIADQNSSNGLLVNGQRQTQSLLKHEDTIQIGPYKITVTTTPNPQPGNRRASDSFIQVPGTPNPEAAVKENQGITPTFPPAEFQQHLVNVQALYATRSPVEEIDYLAVGAGLGSYIWVDFLRIYGVPRQHIRALGLEEKPYGRYQRLCLNSQIPAHERLRSNSDSCPDNLWGWPSYALREAYHDFLQGHFSEAMGYLWQVFGEPTFAETYTPRSGNVFRSIDRETQRIGWPDIYRFGRVRAIRKTDDGRYAIAYSASQGRHALVISRYVHLCTGYPVIQFLPDLQEYREKTGDFKSVVNAYENHDHVYSTLERQGGTVLIRGRGIVASRVIQRLYEARKKNPNISILHLMRSPKPVGNQFGRAQRAVKNHFELQPFNWPKACWGGTLREQLEAASPPERLNLIADWGGTTTADRRDWRTIIQTGLDKGWYQVIFGEVMAVEPDGQGRPLTRIREKAIAGELSLTANYIIDATGLDGKVKATPS